MTLDITFDYADIHSARTMASFLYGRETTGMFGSESAGRGSNNDGIARLLDQAIENVMQDTRREMIDDAAEHITLPRRMIDERIDLIKRKATAGGAGIRISRAPIPIRYFGNITQTSAGVRYQPSTMGRPWLARGAFGPGLPRMRGNVVKRTTKQRHPIATQYGPSLATLMQKYRRRMPLFSKSSSSPWATGFRKRIAREMRRLMQEQIARDAARMLREDQKLFIDNWLQNIFAI